MMGSDASAMSTATSTASSPPPAEFHRPIGVAIVAILVGIYGLLEALGGVLVIIGAVISPWVSVPSEVAGFSGFLLGILLIIIGLIIMAVAAGLWMLRMWAAVIALIVTIISIVFDALGGRYLTVSFIFGIIVLIILLINIRHFK